jgi:hypothetical protein
VIALATLVDALRSGPMLVADLVHEHNRTLLALLDRSRREMVALRAEMLQVRGILGEELR